MVELVPMGHLRSSRYHGQIKTMIRDFGHVKMGKKWICCVFVCVIIIPFLLLNTGDVEEESRDTYGSS